MRRDDAVLTQGYDQSMPHDTPTPPALTFFARIDVQVSAPVEIGETVDGVRRIIPITGGSVAGPEISGRVLDAGADFQLIRTDTLTELEAKYAVETDDGERIYVSNFGIRTGHPDDIAKLVRGEAVDPARIYFMTQPQLRSSATRWRHLEERLFIARGRRYPESVSLDVFMVG